MNLNGTHGTCRSRAKQIEKNGFEPGKRDGKAGTGCYFWAYADSDNTALLLADKWWRYAEKNRWYVRDSDSRLAILSVLITPDDDGFLDCDTLEFRELLCQVAEQQNIKDVKDVAALYNTLITDLENELDKSFQVIRACLQVPKGENSYFNNLYSHYISYIVRKDYKEIIKVVDKRYFI